MDIRLEHIYKTLGNTLILNDVSINFTTRRIHGLAGDNGAGKTALVNILSGVYAPDSGRIVMDDKEIYHTHPSDAIAIGIGTVQQETQIAENLTVAENIFLTATQHTGVGRKMVRWKQMNAKSSELLTQIGFPIDPTRLAKTLNPGQQQLIKIIRALVLEPKVLILDEPTTYLSPQELQWLNETMEQMKRRGSTIIYISHDMEDLLAQCDTITVMRDGKISYSSATANSSPIGNVEELVRLHENLKYPKVRVPVGRTILEVKNLKTERGLEHISFSLRKGEILGVYGELGSGKTSTAKALVGADRILSGTIVLDGEPYRPKDPVHAFDNRIGYLPDDILSYWLFRDLSVAMNLTMSNLTELHDQMRLHTREERSNAARYAKSLKIKMENPDSFIYQLSGGNQQKVAIAKLLFSDSKVLILDEPTKHLDSSTKIEVYNLMNRCTGDGMSILFISSDLKELKGMCDRIMVMQKGKGVEWIKPE
jgi:ABC-type sugar transport system ATPase subunit